MALPTSTGGRRLGWTAPWPPAVLPPGHARERRCLADGGVTGHGLGGRGGRPAALAGACHRRTGYRLSSPVADLPAVAAPGRRCPGLTGGHTVAALRQLGYVAPRPARRAAGGPGGPVAGSVARPRSRGRSSARSSPLRLLSSSAACDASTPLEVGQLVAGRSTPWPRRTRSAPLSSSPGTRHAASPRGHPRHCPPVVGRVFALAGAAEAGVVRPSPAARAGRRPATSTTRPAAGCPSHSSSCCCPGRSLPARVGSPRSATAARARRFRRSAIPQPAAAIRSSAIR